MALQLWTNLSPQECRQRFSSIRVGELPRDVKWEFTEKGQLALDPQIRGYRRKYVAAWTERSGGGADITLAHRDPLSQRILFWFCQGTFLLIALAGVFFGDAVTFIAGAVFLVGNHFLTRWMEGVSQKCVNDFLHETLDAQELS